MYLAKRTAPKELALIAGSLKRNESIGMAARRILRAETGLASFTDVIGIRVVNGQKRSVVKVIAALTVDSEVAGSKAKAGWRWVDFSRLLSPRDYSMLNYLLGRSTLARQLSPELSFLKSAL